jgi:TetR/AcrR family transcriptional regulator
VARRSNDPVYTREIILKYGTEEFARLGFGGARVDRIAERCSLSKNMLYYYFGSKEGLFIAVLEKMYQSLRDQQRDISVRASDPLLALEQLIRHTFNALKENPSAIPLMNEENKHQGKYIRKSGRMRALYNPLVETVSLILKKGCDEGVFRPGLDPVEVYLSLSSLCYHLLSNQYTLEIALNRDLRSQKAQKKWLDHVVETISLYCVRDSATILSKRQKSRSIAA